MADVIDRALVGVTERWKRLRTMEASLRAGIVLLAGLLLLVALDNVFHLGTAARVGLTLAWLASVAAAAGRPLWRPLVRPLDRTESAILIERAAPEVDNRVINAERLARDAGVPPLVLGLVRGEAAQAVERLDLRRILPLAALRPLAAAGGIAGALLIAYAILFPAYFANAVRRYASPGSFIPPITRTLLRVSPGSATVDEGGRLVVRAEVAGEIPPGARLRVGEAAYDMRFTGGAFRHEFQKIETPFEYRVEAGDARSDVYRVDVRRRARVLRLAVRYVFPDYLGRPPRDEDPAAGNLAAVEGTRAEIAIETTKPLRSLRLAADPDFNPRGRGERWALDLVRGGAYRFEWVDRDGIDGRSPGYTISALKDQPPKVRLLEPARPLAVRPDGEVSVVAHASDDFALDAVALRATVGTGPAVELASQPAEGKTELRLARRLDLAELQVKPGDSVALVALARDRKGSESISAAVVLRVIDAIASRDQIVKELGSLLARLRQVIARQTQVRARTLAPRPNADVLAADQAGILQALIDIRAAWVHPDLRHLAARARLEDVIRGPAAEAPAKIKTDLAAAAELQARILRELDAIVAALEGLVAALQKGAVDQALAAAAEKTPRQELRDLLAGLKDFVEHQKKVIQDSVDLSKTKPEDFSDEQKRVLETLRQTEAQWGKLLQEKATDLSKVPPQDFSVAGLVKELNEATSEVKLAADALDRKAVEMAIPHEESGLELAKAITENIERWLADAPDNLKWVMEEPMKEADVPMADLPAELEDLIGDLIDKEDKLAEDSQDVTSSWMDSMDKGAGWTAMDGPISNMSAKGVTGNLQPNAMEIAGRSGEGRSGKSAGQMVEETASGKGGKQTPTRSTPDPFEAGRVKDTSKDPTGGSTGGGKVSGADAEGLRGTPPPPVRQQLERLADRQAEVRSTSEKANVAMRKRGMVSEDLQRAIDRMKKLEALLRQKQPAPFANDARAIAEHLRDVQKTVRDQVELMRDPTRGLAREARSELLNAADEEIPAEFRDWITEYYKALAR
jgi:hypothetical protein